MQLQSKSICAILLASSFASGFTWSPFLNKAQGLLGRRQIIGYRTVNRLEADIINDNHKPFRDKRLDENGRYHQLGHGFYISNEAAFWKGRRGDWYCAVKADKNKIAKADKIYIPEYYPKTTSDGPIKKTHLWAGDEDEILEYIESAKSMIPNPEKALRFSLIMYEGLSLQMVVPTDMVNDDELDLWGKCFETKKELLEYSGETINWKKRWGIIGDPGQPY
ncbi:hypothetical protein LZ554_005529 [Drepanopeziza brunnea f. sp. 'monogermtubi']|nr:hypothetical protein LZ554_005529 [Drepanopeziza brunnea f. sp. 'monogermtubi']